MRTLKTKLLSQDNLKNKIMDKIADLDSPIPIEVKDLNLPSSVSVEKSGIMSEEEIKNYRFWQEILESNP
jgi:hypothetical protein